MSRDIATGQFSLRESANEDFLTESRNLPTRQVAITALNLQAVMDVWYRTNDLIRDRYRFECLVSGFNIPQSQQNAREQIEIIYKRVDGFFSDATFDIGHRLEEVVDRTIRSLPADISLEKHLARSADRFQKLREDLKVLTVGTLYLGMKIYPDADFQMKARTLLRELGAPLSAQGYGPLYSFAGPT